MDNSRKWVSIIQQTSIWIPLVLLWGYAVVKTELVIAIIAAAATILAAVITAAINICMQGRTLKRDSNTIESIHKECSEEIEPSVREIQSTQTAQTAKLDALVSDLDHRKRMEAVAGSGAVNSRDAAFKTIDTLFEQYAAAQKENALLRQQVAQLTKEIELLRAYIPDRSRHSSDRSRER